MDKNVHPNLALVLLFVRTKVEFRKGLLVFHRNPFSTLPGREQHRELIAFLKSLTHYKKRWPGSAQAWMA